MIDKRRSYKSKYYIEDIFHCNNLLFNELARSRDKYILSNKKMFDFLNIIEKEIYAFKIKIKLFNDNWIKQQYFSTESDENIITFNYNIKKYNSALND